MGKHIVSSDNGNGKYGIRRALICTGAVFCCIFLVIAVLVGIWFYEESVIYKICSVEAGTDVEASDFLKNSDGDAIFVGDKTVSTDKIGEFTLRIKDSVFTHTVILVVKDTVAPVYDVQNLEIVLGENCAPEDFVLNIEDATEVTVAYASEPDWSLFGTQEIELCLTDEGGNTSLASTQLYISPVNLEVTVEAGANSLEIEDFTAPGVEATFITRVDLLDFNTVGDYTVVCYVQGVAYSSVLHVTDTVAPEVITCDVESYPRLNLSEEDFIVQINDATDVIAEFMGEPDLTMTGTQELSIAFTDEGGNTTVKNVKLTNNEDTEAPVINGAKDIDAYIGDGVSYSNGVTVTDNSKDELKVEVDNSQVNLNEAGSYTLVYSAADASGNEASVAVTVNVMNKKYTEETVYELANQVLDEILTDDMTDREKVYAIYYYTYNHIAYVGTSEKGDWLSAAYEGIVYGKGDCYTYACTAQALYNCAGITNMMISKIPTEDSSHYWNLVDIGDGWYHVDSTRRIDHTTIFMWTDAELMEYSEANDLSHNYDHSQYPQVN